MARQGKLRISIVVPYYNTPVRYLSPFLESVLNQDYGNFELIAVNDGSTDEESLAFLRGIRDSRLTVLDAGHGGVSAARNLGMGHISGDLLYFADSDDELMPGLFSHMAGCFEEDPELDFLIFSTDKRTRKGKIKPHQHIQQPFTFTGKEGFAAVCTTNSFMYNNLWGKVYNVSHIGKDKLVRFDTSLKYMEDRFFNLMMMQSVSKGRTSSFIGYIYNERPGSATHKKGVEIDVLHAFDRMLEYIEGKEGRSDDYYEMMAVYYLKAQRFLKEHVFSIGDADRKVFRSTLISLQKELEGREIKSTKYARRKGRTPLLLFVTKI